MDWAKGEPAIEDVWKLTQRSLGSAIGVALRMGWTTRRWLPSVNALLPVAYLAFKSGGRIAREDEAEAARFLCLAAWTGAFSGASETAIDKFINRLKEPGRCRSAKTLTDAIPKRGLTKVSHDDVRRESNPTGALMQVYLAYLVSRNAKSWPSGQLLADVCKFCDGVGGPEVHHIFPRKFIEDAEVGLDAHTMGNYAILSECDNASLADEDPQTRV